MILSDHIARLIEEMLEEGGGSAEVRRNDLAARIGCVPSQINYVITSRFTPERGYSIESRRGGGGYIRIVRVPMTKNEYLMHVFHSVGDSLNESESRAFLRNLLEQGIRVKRGSVRLRLRMRLIVNASTAWPISTSRPTRAAAAIPN